MTPVGGLMIVLAVAVIGFVAYNSNKTKKNLEEKKMIIPRMARFWQEEEWFFTDASYQDFLKGVEQTDFSECKCAVYPNYSNAQCVYFKSEDAYNALILYKGTQDGRHVFKFSFYKWREKNGLPDYTSMNVLMTQIEKIFLVLDPETTVESHKMQIKTKTSIV